MESKDWSGFGYFSPDFSPGMLGNVSSHLKHYQLSIQIVDYKLILFRSGQFDHDMEKNITVIGMF